MSNSVWTYPHFGDRGNLFRQPTSVAAHQIVDSKPGERLTIAVEEDVFGRRPASGYARKSFCSRRPKGAATDFPPFAHHLDEGLLFLKARCQIQVSDRQLCYLVCPAAGVVKEKQEGIVAVALARLKVWEPEERLHFGVFQVRG